MIELNIETRLRELKGAPLAVFVLLSVSAQPIGNEYIARTTGYTDKPIKQALLYLQEKGWITRTSIGWVSLQGAVQLPLSPGDDGEDTEDASRNYSDSVDETFDNSVDNCNMSRNNSDSPSSSSYIDLKNTKDQLLTTSNRKISDSVLGKLDQVGIREPVRHELAGLPWVNSAYIEAMAAQVSFEKQGTGLLVYRMRNHFSAPTLRSNGHIKACRCDECSRLRYEDDWCEYD